MENEIVKVEKGMTALDVKAQVQKIQEIMNAVMIGPSKDNPGGVHYGLVPGCGDKPTLLKPGAEKIMMTFQLAADPQIEDLSIGDELRRYRVITRLSTRTGVFVGAGVGECSTDEEKYKWRSAVCDEEFDATPIDHRREKWSKGRYNKENRSYGKAYQTKQVRTNPADLANTVLKMAKKRSLVDAVLTATAASDIFEQDLDDMSGDAEAVVTEQRQAVAPTVQQPQPVKPSAPAPAAPTTTAAAASARPLVGKATDKQINAILKMSDAAGFDAVEIIKTRYGKQTVDDLTKEEASNLIGHLSQEMDKNHAA